MKWSAFETSPAQPLDRQQSAVSQACRHFVARQSGDRNAAGDDGRCLPRRSGLASATSMWMDRPSSVCRAADRQTGKPQVELTRQCSPKSLHFTKQWHALQERLSKCGDGYTAKTVRSDGSGQAEAEDTEGHRDRSDFSGVHFCEVTTAASS